jgi:hypothetical protein
MSTTLALGLSDHNVAATSIIGCAAVIALGAFKMAGTTPVKIIATVAAMLLAGYAIYLYNANEKVKVEQNPRLQKYAEQCHILLAGVEQGLHDKLLHEGDLKETRAVARGLLRDIDASECKKPAPVKD